MNKRVLAFDFGASSGRAMIGEFDGQIITLTEIHRFLNEPVSLMGTLYWDTLRLFHEIKQGIIKAKLSGGFDSIGINTWGVDFGLLDGGGRLLESSVNYRDKRTEGMLGKCFEKISPESLYMQTGNQIMPINTAFQLLSLTEDRLEILDRAKHMLLTPDLFNFFLTGEMVTEYSIASTTQLCNPKTRDWNTDIIKTLGLKEDIFGEIVPSGTIIGNLSDEICEELGVKKCPVIAVCGHDTQCAVVATPSQDKDFIFLSCGTWSLLGTEISEPILNKESCSLNITNEGGYGDTTTFLKNIIGLWLIQESRRQWIREGKEYSYAELEKLALESEPFKCFIDPDAEEFVGVGNIPQRVQNFCEKTGQEIPCGVGEIIRCIYESLALKYKYSLDQIVQCTKKDYDKIHVLGGGTKDTLLCQMTANACNMQVVAGPIEATVFGNIAVQLMTCKDIENISKAREIIKNSDTIKEYQPQGNDEWQNAYQRFAKIIIK